MGAQLLKCQYLTVTKVKMMNDINTHIWEILREFVPI